MDLTTSRRGFLFLGAAALSTGCGRELPPLIKIGVAQPLSGSLAPFGQDLLNGVRMAVDDLNRQAALVRGRPLRFEVVAADDKADAETGRQVARQLVGAGVVAVVGHFNSGVSIAAAPVYAERGIAQLAISTHPKFTELGFNTTFRLVANDRLQAKAMGAFALQRFGDARFAAVDDGTLYGKELMGGVLATLGAARKAPVLSESLDGKTVAFEALVRRLKTADAQVLLTTLSDFQVAALLGALQGQGLEGLKILGGDTIKSALLPVLAKTMDLRDKLFATSAILEAADFSNGRAFLARYNAKYGAAAAFGSHYAYDATHQVAAAIRHAESAEPARICEALRAIDSYVPVTGYMKWDARGEQAYGAAAVYTARRESWNLLTSSANW